MTSTRTLVEPQPRQESTEVIEPDRRVRIPTQDLLEKSSLPRHEVILRTPPEPHPYCTSTPSAPSSNALRPPNSFCSIPPNSSARLPTTTQARFTCSATNGATNISAATMTLPSTTKNRARRVELEVRVPRPFPDRLQNELPEPLGRFLAGLLGRRRGLLALQPERRNQDRPLLLVERLVHERPGMRDIEHLGQRAHGHTGRVGARHRPVEVPEEVRGAGRPRGRRPDTDPCESQARLTEPEFWLSSG